jgi:hypothetical protein
MAAAVVISAAMSACVQTPTPQKAAPKAAATADHAVAPIDVNAAVAHLRASLREINTYDHHSDRRRARLSDGGVHLVSTARS